MHYQTRRSRTQTLIQAGNLLQKSGLLDAFSIKTGDDLQSSEMRLKAVQLLGFLNSCFQSKNEGFDKTHMHDWERIGQQLLRMRGPL